MKGNGMVKQNILRTALVLSMALLLCGAAAKTNVGFAQKPVRTPAPGPAQNPCASTSDAQIVTAIQEKIKADHRFDDQWKHINVSSRNRIVTLRGWVKGSVQVKDLVRFASTTNCVKHVINKLSPRRKIGCPPGTTPCGDTCIGKGEECNIIQ
jgi:osmotically-inducible protein OsmY